jgi:hypothetical protein
VRHDLRNEQRGVVEKILLVAKKMCIQIIKTVEATSKPTLPQQVQRAVFKN